MAKPMTRPGMTGGVAKDDDLRYRLRNIWYGIIHRTTNPDHWNYAKYGGRGIGLSDRWHSFENFYDDMVEGYSPGLSVERIDNHGDYSSDNCRWATAKEQANNTRRNRSFTIAGETRTLAQWISFVGAKSSTVRQRFYVLGWPIEDSLFGKKG